MAPMQKRVSFRVPVTERIVYTRRICHAAGPAERLTLLHICIVPPGRWGCQSMGGVKGSVESEKAGASAEAPALLEFNDVQNLSGLLVKIWMTVIHVSQ